MWESQPAGNDKSMSVVTVHDVYNRDGQPFLLQTVAEMGCRKLSETTGASKHNRFSTSLNGAFQYHNSIRVTQISWRKEVHLHGKPLTVIHQQHTDLCLRLLEFIFIRLRTYDYGVKKRDFNCDHHKTKLPPVPNSLMMVFQCDY